MNSTGLLNPDRTVTPYGNTGGGSEGDEIQWITKEQWDAMTPEQKSDPNVTYGVRGLGSPGEVETASIAGSLGSPIINFRKKDGIIFTEPVGTIALSSGSYNPFVQVAEYDIPSGFGVGHNNTIYTVMMTNHKNILVCSFGSTKITITTWIESVTLASDEWAFFPSVTYLAD